MQEPLGPSGSRLTIEINDDNEAVQPLGNWYMSGRFSSVAHPVGRYNVSAVWECCGAAASSPTTYQFDADGTPYQVTVVPAVTSVQPNVGSVAGGTVLTITGTSFNADEPDANTVSVGGIPCEVLSVAQFEITCRLAHDPALAPEVDAACAAPSLKTDQVDDTHWLGSRGVTQDTWDFAQNVYSDLDMSLSRQVRVDPFMSSVLSLGHRTLQMSAYLVLPMSGTFSFFLVSDDNGALYLDGTRIAHESGWRALLRPETSQLHQEGSYPFDLVAGHPYHLRATSSSGAGPGYAYVGMIVQSSDTVAMKAHLPDTATPIGEQQRYYYNNANVAAAPTKDHFTFSVPAGALDTASVTLSASSPLLPETLSVTVPATATSEELGAAVTSTFATAHCVYDDGAGIVDDDAEGVYYRATFEDVRGVVDVVDRTCFLLSLFFKLFVCCCCSRTTVTTETGTFRLATARSSSVQHQTRTVGAGPCTFQFPAVVGSKSRDSRRTARARGIVAAATDATTQTVSWCCSAPCCAVLRRAAPCCAVLRLAPGAVCCVLCVVCCVLCVVCCHLVHVFCPPPLIVLAQISRTCAWRPRSRPGQKQPC